MGNPISNQAGKMPRWISISPLDKRDSIFYIYDSQVDSGVDSKELMTCSSAEQRKGFQPSRALTFPSLPIFRNLHSGGTTWRRSST